MMLWERVAPSYVGRGGFAPVMRLTGVISLGAGFLVLYQSSARMLTGLSCVAIVTMVLMTLILNIVRFYGFTENKREYDMDVREMVDKAKRGEPLYGKSDMSPYMQGMASRNSRYTGLFLHVIPWFNFVNHNQVRHNSRPISVQSANLENKHGVDTAKYYQQAERELEAERAGKATS